MTRCRSPRGKIAHAARKKRLDPQKADYVIERERRIVRVRRPAVKQVAANIEVREKGIILRHITDTPLPNEKGRSPVGESDAIKLDQVALNRAQAGYRLQKRGLACAGWAKDCGPSGIDLGIDLEA